MAIEYSEETVKKYFTGVTNLELPDDDLFELFFDHADEKSGDDGLTGSKRVIGVCYLIANAMSAKYTRPDGRHIAVSSSIFGVSKSVTPPKNKDVADQHIWMDLYQDLVDESKGNRAGGGGGMSFNAIPRTALDSATYRNQRMYWKKDNDGTFYG